MAKECLIQKQKKLAQKWEALRKEEEAILALPKEKREEALAEFNAKRVKNRMFKSRMYNRCAITGRARGYLGYFGVCRQVFREKAHRGELPGVKKSSW
jgi:small subunit ribosomal protein S14